MRGLREDIFVYIFSDLFALEARVIKNSQRYCEVMYEYWRTDGLFIHHGKERGENGILNDATNKYRRKEYFLKNRRAICKEMNKNLFWKPPFISKIKFPFK